MALHRVNTVLTHLKNLQKIKAAPTFDSKILSEVQILSMNKLESGTSQLKLTIPVLPDFCNSYGPLHGGAIATMIDVYTTLAIWGVDSQNRMTVSVDLDISYVSMGQAGDILTILANCHKVGKTMAYTSAEIYKEENKLVALGKHTKFFLDKKLEIPGL
jgi:acyl-coenzyme A thioesterase 13